MDRREFVKTVAGGAVSVPLLGQAGLASTALVGALVESKAEPKLNVGPAEIRRPIVIVEQQTECPYNYGHSSTILEAQLFGKHHCPDKGLVPVTFPISKEVLEDYATNVNERIRRNYFSFCTASSCFSPKEFPRCGEFNALEIKVDGETLVVRGVVCYNESPEIFEQIEKDNVRLVCEADWDFGFDPNSLSTSGECKKIRITQPRFRLELIDRLLA